MTEQASYGARSKYFGKVAKSYDAVRRKQNKWAIEQSLVEDFVAGAQAGETVLDAPFGTGRFAQIYLDRKLKVCGVDISDDMLDQARAALGEAAAECQIQTADALDLPFEDNSFDYLVCNRFIKWLPQLSMVDRAFSEFSRVSRGQILVQWNVKREKNVISRYAGKVTGKGATEAHAAPSGSKTKYRESDILALCGKHSLEIVKNFAPPGRSTGIRYLLLRQGKLL